jgi:hypothetical protein
MLMSDDISGRIILKCIYYSTQNNMTKIQNQTSASPRQMHIAIPTNIHTSIGVRGHHRICEHLGHSVTAAAHFFQTWRGRNACYCTVSSLLRDELTSLAGQLMCSQCRQVQLLNATGFFQRNFQSYLLVITD